MFEGARIQVDKLENGYGIKMPVFSNGGEPTERKYVYKTFDEMVDNMRRVFSPSEIRHARGFDLSAESKASGPALETMVETMRDEIGELRRTVERRDKRLAELSERETTLGKIAAREQDRADKLQEKVTMAEKLKSMPPKKSPPRKR